MTPDRIARFEEMARGADVSGRDRAVGAAEHAACAREDAEWAALVAEVLAELRAGGARPGGEKP